MKLFRKKSPQAMVYSPDAKNKVDIGWAKQIPDDEVLRLNELLPWASFNVDLDGRIIGKPYSADKRHDPQVIPDRRIQELDKRIGLKGKTVLEAGCFEGHHTTALCDYGAEVYAFDGRVENVIKTLSRCALFGFFPKVFYWDLEEAGPEFLPQNFDVFHHIGVLYHLSDTLAHLQKTLKSVSGVLLLDTHVAGKAETLEIAECDGFEYKYSSFKESGREPPFAGLTPYAKWIALSDLTRFIERQGFSRVQVTEFREERNGDRVLITAMR